MSIPTGVCANVSSCAPDAIADAANLSRASLYRLLAAEGGIRAVLVKRRLDEALRLLLADSKDEPSLTEVAKRCGFGGTSQFSRAFRARFGLPPRQYRALVHTWHSAPEAHVAQEAYARWLEESGLPAKVR